MHPPHHPTFLGRSAHRSSWLHLGAFPERRSRLSRTTLSTRRCKPPSDAEHWAGDAGASPGSGRRSSSSIIDVFPAKDTDLPVEPAAEMDSDMELIVCRYCAPSPHITCRHVT